MGAFFLLAAGIGSLIASFLVFSEAKSAIHEILGAVLSVDGSILIVGGMVLSALNSGQEKTEALLKAMLPNQSDTDGSKQTAPASGVNVTVLTEEQQLAEISFTRNTRIAWAIVAGTTLLFIIIASVYQ
jgi:hypothetical protein